MSIFTQLTIATVLPKVGRQLLSLARYSLLTLSLAVITAPSAADEFANWESPHVHPLDRTPDGSTLLAVNTATHLLEVFDIQADGSLQHRQSIPVGLDPVSVRARTNSEAWVVNHVSDSVSIVDLDRGTVVAVLQTEDEPADVVFSAANQRAFVSCSQDNSVLVFNTAFPNLPPQRLAINGEDPRALAISPDGETVYATIFESGNQTTILAGGRRSGDPGNVVDDPRGPYGGVNPPPNDGAGFFPAFNPALPPAPPVGLIVHKSEDRWLDDNGGDWTSFVSGELSAESSRVRGWDLPDRDVAVIDADSLSVSYEHSVMNMLMATAVNPASGELTVVGTDAVNHIRFEPNFRSHFIQVMFARLGASAEPQRSDLNPQLDDGVETVPLAQRRDSLGDPRAIVWEPSGQLAYVAGMGSNNIVMIDAEGQRVAGVAPIAVGEGPTGLVLDQDADTMYVLNRFDASISVIDTADHSTLATTQFFDTTPPRINDGRRVLYNTHESSGRGQIACGSCHVDARYDRLAWDLGNPAGDMQVVGNAEFHPMKGPMRTTSLIGIVGSPLLHFRGDRNNVLEFDHAFEALQGLEAPMDRPRMEALEDMLASILTPPNPYRALDNSMPNQVRIPGPNGRIGNPNLHSGQNNCRPCHAPETNARDGVVRLNSGNFAGPQPAIAPSLRSMYEVLGLYYNSPDASNAGYGYIHDGSFDENTQGTLRNDNNLAFMLALNGDLPGDTHAAVGRQVIVSAELGTSDTVLLNNLRRLADQGAIGLVAKGMIGGQSREYLYLTAGQYQSDRAAERLGHAQLLNAAAAADSVLVFTAVPRNSRERIGIDRDNDGILNGDDDENRLPRAVDIVNADFEQQVFPNGGFALNNIAGWTVQSARAGVWNATAGSYSQEAPQGSNVAFIDLGGSISQTLNETLAADTALRVSVLVGDERSAANSAGWGLRLYAGSQLLGAIDNSDFDPTDDTFVRATLSLSAADLSRFSANFGQPLRIELFDNGAAANVHFDDVQMLVIPTGDGGDPAPNPEPQPPRDVAVVNAGFEAQVFANGRFALNNISGWTVQSARAGVWNATRGSYSQEAPEGANVAFIDVGGSISQVLQETLQANTALRLSVRVGDERYRGDSAAWAVRLYAGSQLLGSMDNSDFNPVDDSFADATLALTSEQLSAYASFYGQRLRIELFDAGTAANVHFDDVRLQAIDERLPPEPEPEPEPQPEPTTPRAASIVNAGFESQDLSGGGVIRDVINGWTVQSARAGIWNATAGSYPERAPEGLNVAFIDIGGSISQVLAETLAPNTALRLSVMVGDARSRGDASAWALRLYAGSQLLGQVDNSDVDPTDGTFADATLALAPAELSRFSSQYGQALRIELFDAGTAANVHFDDVRLIVIE